MKCELQVRNRQRIRRINLRYLRRLVETVLEELVVAKEYQLCIHIVAKPEMKHLNETFLRHSGSTDVITFGYTDDAVQRARGYRSHLRYRPNRPPSSELHGEIFVCVDEAITQARRFRTTWESEIVRYVIHGLLHLLGFDDKKGQARRKMKHEENCLLRQLGGRFRFGKLAVVRRSKQAIVFNYP